MKNRVKQYCLALAVLCAFPVAVVATPAAQKPVAVAKAEFNPKTIAWTPQVAYRSATLRIAGPGGFFFDRNFGAGKPVFDLSEMPYLADGKYVYEIVLGQTPDEALARSVSRAEFAEDGSVADPAIAAKIASLRETVSGTFTIAEGKIVSPYLIEPASLKGASSAKDIVNADDVIVQGSLCVGFDCINNESFGFDTIRLKENNTRIGFSDTSVAPFPANAWQLTANDSASGGANKFSIEDITNARVPFTTTAGAPNNSLFIASSGRVGFRTATPVLDLHAVTGNTPAIRLEQDGSSGFTAQTWDVAANETNFFIRDVTGGSRLPFRIRPGAPTSSIDIASSGNVGIGTSSPAKKLSVSNNGNAGFEVDPVAYAGGIRLIAYDRTAASYIPARWEALVHEFHSSMNERMRIDPSGNVGIGTATPAKKLAVSNGGAEGFEVDPIAYSGGVRLIVFNRSTASYIPARWEASQHEFNVSGVEHARIDAAGNLGLGTASPIAKLHVEGNARINGSLQVTGPCCGPDYVFSPGFKVASIEENAAYMWKNRHLPAVGPAKTTDDGRAVVNVFSQANGMLEELEKAHIYIEQLHKEIKTLRAEAEGRDSAIRQELAELRAILRK